MTTENKSESTPVEASDNKAIFGPLGKYAIVAVLMVSAIVTTAIMLNKQLSTVDEQLAAIEEEVAEMHTASADTSTDEAKIAEAAMAEVTTAESTTVADTEIKAEVAEEAVVTAAAPVAAPIEAPSAEVLVAQETAAAPVVTETKHNTAQAVPATTAQFELATAETAAQARQAKLAKEYQARIEAYKAEQKQHMTEMFARIKTLEAKQLDRYKANQDGQIARLREQIAQQQQMIDALALRNKDLFELRAAKVQRNQANREQALNRI